MLLSGSALAVNWAQDHVPAIVEAWYPGEAGGVAIADVLFGDYNPAGRLPVTFYRSVDDLPPFHDGVLSPATPSSFFNGRHSTPSAAGWSYTFRSATIHARTSSDSLATDSSITVRRVTNTGKRAGDEVVQLYVQHLDSKIERPRLDLRGYRRIFLTPGESRTVTFELPAKALSYWDPLGSAIRN